MHYTVSGLIDLTQDGPSDKTVAHVSKTEVTDTEMKDTYLITRVM